MKVAVDDGRQGSLSLGERVGVRVLWIGHGLFNMKVARMKFRFTLVGAAVVLLASAAAASVWAQVGAAAKPAIARPRTTAAKPAIVKPRAAVKPANGAKRMSVPARPASRPAAGRSIPAARPGTSAPLSTVTRTSDSGEYRDMLAGLIR